MAENKKEFIVTKNKNESVTFTIRIDKSLQMELDELATKSGRSRNDLIQRSIRFALDNLKYIDED